MVDVILLHHPQSPDLLGNQIENDEDVTVHRIACGTSKVVAGAYSESGDFNPNFASLNSCLFESSVILTAWEHIDELAKSDVVAILHTDVDKNYAGVDLWRKIAAFTKTHNVGLTMSPDHLFKFKDHVLVDNARLRFKNDPYRVHSFDHGIDVWGIVQKVDKELYEWASNENPVMIYSHQFACSKRVFKKLGVNLYKALSRINLADVGLWIPHIFERLIALNLAKLGYVKITDYFRHYGSSGIKGQADLKLYGPREYKFFRLRDVQKLRSQAERL
jgi:hypothetical protein